MDEATRSDVLRAFEEEAGEPPAQRPEGWELCLLARLASRRTGRGAKKLERLLLGKATTLQECLDLLQQALAPAPPAALSALSALPEVEEAKELLGAAARSRSPRRDLRRAGEALRRAGPLRTPSAADAAASLLAAGRSLVQDGDEWGPLAAQAQTLACAFFWTGPQSSKLGWVEIKGRMPVSSLGKDTKPPDDAGPKNLTAPVGASAATAGENLAEVRLSHRSHLVVCSMSPAAKQPRWCADERGSSFSLRLRQDQPGPASLLPCRECSWPVCVIAGCPGKKLAVGFVGPWVRDGQPSCPGRTSRTSGMKSLPEVRGGLNSVLESERPSRTCGNPCA